MPDWFMKSGEDLIGGWMACLDGIVADQEYLHRILKLKSVFATRAKCFRVFGF